MRNGKEIHKETSGFFILTPNSDHSVLMALPKNPSTYAGLSMRDRGQPQKTWNYLLEDGPLIVQAPPNPAR